MENIEYKIFSDVLHIQDPFVLSNIVVATTGKRVDIYVDFIDNPKFICSECDTESTQVHDVREKVWRHLNLFEYHCYVHCRTPRIFCPKCKKPCDIKIPWVRKGSGFSLMMEGLILSLHKSMPVATIGYLLGETDKRLSRIIKFYVESACKKKDLSHTKNIGIDETSVAKGHKYITTVTDLDKGEVIFVTAGKEADCLSSFQTYLHHHRGQSKNIKNICSDMSRAFISGIETVFPHATHTFDKFHVMMAVNNAVDKVRRGESRLYTLKDILKKTKYLFLKNPGNLSNDQKERLDELTISHKNIKTVHAYHMKLNFMDFWKCKSKREGKNYLKKWLKWVSSTRLKPMLELAETIKNHEDGILNYFTSRITNGKIEAINGQIQKLKREARGYRNIGNFRNAILLRYGNLDFDIPLTLL